VENGIECFKCGFWFHDRCEGLSKDIFRKYNDPKFSDWNWFCRKCSGDMFIKITEHEEKITYLEKKLEDYCNIFQRMDNLEKLFNEELNKKRDVDLEIENLHTDNQSCLTGIRTELKHVQDTADALKESFHAQNINIVESLDRQPKPGHILSQVLQESEDRLRRSRNILILNAPEPSAESSISRRNADRNIAESVISKVTSDSSIEISQTYRIGKWNGSKNDIKNRPLLMVLKSSSQRDMVLQYSQRIRKQLHPIVIRPDYTITQRLEMKNKETECTPEALHYEINLPIDSISIPKNGHVPRIYQDYTPPRSIC
jgi:hypothetical protein